VIVVVVILSGAGRAGAGALTAGDGGKDYVAVQGIADGECDVAELLVRRKMTTAADLRRKPSGGSSWGFCFR
jgi:hypothetical protein